MKSTREKWRGTRYDFYLLAHEHLYVFRRPAKNCRPTFDAPAFSFAAAFLSRAQTSFAITMGGNPSMRRRETGLSCLISTQRAWR